MSARTSKIDDRHFHVHVFRLHENNLQNIVVLSLILISYRGWKIKGAQNSNSITDTQSLSFHIKLNKLKRDSEDKVVCFRQQQQ